MSKSKLERVICTRPVLASWCHCAASERPRGIPQVEQGMEGNLIAGSLNDSTGTVKFDRLPAPVIISRRCFKLHAPEWRVKE